MGKYTYVGLPMELVKEIDAVIINYRFGYKSRAEFVKDAVRELLIKIKGLAN